MDHTPLEYSPICDDCKTPVDGGGCDCPYCHRCGELTKAEDLLEDLCASCRKERDTESDEAGS
jgi:hypothetical protein